MNNLQVVVNQGQRVLTTKQLAEVYGTDAKNVQMNFRNHQGRFVEGKHYYLLHSNELKEFKYRVNDIGLVGKNTSSLYLWTERGALRHAKILDTEKAWGVYEKLEDTYFRVKELEGVKKLSPLEQLKLQYEVLDDHDKRLANLESNMTIDFGQQKKLGDIAKRKAIEALGGTYKPAYKDKGIRTKVFSRVWRDLKDYFEVNSYRDTPKKDFERAKEHLENWQPQGKLLKEIEDCNNQVKLQEIC